ncbi:MAG: hypothetical protein PVJ66_07225 [Gammaproteobacteria bacterium]
MRMTKFGGFLALSLGLLTACAELQHSGDKETMALVSADNCLNRQLEDLHAIRTMSPEALQQTLEYRERAFRDVPDANNRLRLALLLATGSKPVRDRERALQLLAGFDPPPANTGDRELIAILQQFLDEQRDTRGEMNALRKQVMKQAKRIEELEQQQRALTNIEQRIQQRENPAGGENGN